MNTPNPPQRPPDSPQLPVLSPEAMARLQLQSGDHDHDEAVKAWLKKNLNTILIGIALGLLALFAWQWWQAQQAQQAQLRAAQYSKFLQAESQGNQAAADAVAKSLTAEKNLYGTLVVLQQAQRVANNQAYAEAEKLLQPLASDAKNPLQSLAQLRLAAVLTAQGKNSAALEQLNALPQEELPLIAEWRGDLFAALGQSSDARNAYIQALAQNGDSERIQYKISLLMLINNAAPVMETPVMETPVMETPAMENPVVENPVVENPVVENPVVENPVVETPVSETPVSETPVSETPVVETPVSETPVMETPVMETPVVETPVMETPVVETPVVETPVMETPVVETPVVETPVVETPVMETTVGAPTLLLP